MNRTGLLVVNLGTPDSTSVGDVRRYLREFLSDPRVIDIPAPLRWLLLNFVILPFRPKQSAEAYEQVWTDRGSPLLFHGNDLVAKIRERIGPEIPVELAMRYQNPSIAAALDRLADQGVDRLVVFPLFPQYSSAATGSALQEVFELAGAHWNVPAVQVVPPFYDAKPFIDAFARVAEPVIGDLSPDLVLLSFHGLPERHCKKSDEAGNHCLVKPDCCAAIVDANRNCYRAQCFATARGLAAALGLADDEYEVTFQSRLGRTPWIQPYTDVRLAELAEAGVKKVAVMSPAFVADCLETLEEIAIRGSEQFLAAGGDELRLVPSLNAEDVWADAVVALVAPALGEAYDPRSDESGPKGGNESA